MKSKLRLPILLMAIVIMLSIFYIKEAQNNGQDGPVNGGDLTTVTLNPEFTEARINRIEEVNSEIEELEEILASGGISMEKIISTNAMINDLKAIRQLEVGLEEQIVDTLNYNDVLVILADDEVIIDVYTDLEVSILEKVEILQMAANSFSSYAENYSITVSTSFE